MLDKLEKRDKRNLVLVAGLVGLLTAATTDGPIAVRLVTGVVSGLISAATFTVVTLVLKKYVPNF